MMRRPKQATLFQSWGGKTQNQQAGKSGNSAKQRQHKESSYQNERPDFINLLLDSDGDDQELALAVEHNTAGQDADSNDCNVSFGIENRDAELGTDRHYSTNPAAGELKGFDGHAGKLWIYPTNYPERKYQFSIVCEALRKNTLVTLPTGLGKTFIASVVMYNFYRWYPEGKVVFMAPTKPLVAQQIEACCSIVGIPRGDTAEMTGSMNPTDRKKAWQDQRVFFLTPQVMTNDLSRGTCAAESIKLVVVDEAHKALGNHAYCQVVRELVKYTDQFRVLALSATPGNDIKAVQKVVSNLLISHIELRSEDSPDIKPYTHKRTVDKIVVPLGEELNRIKTKYTQVLQVVVKRLIHQRVLYNREATSLSKFLILKAREAFRQNPPENLLRSQYGVVEGDFALAMSLYHGYELLQLHGLRSLHNFLEGIVSGTKSYQRTRTELMKNADFVEVMEMLKEKFYPSEQSKDKPAFLAGHPKLVKLEEVVVNHFQTFHAGEATRVMIFSQYRDSVQEITAMLQQHEPLVKVMSFIGQSSVGKSTKGFTQKEQLKVMQEFRTGGYNTLVSTCVGEEGLDIGEVDLIVCYDAHNSPVRLVQRMGRTGRKRQGRIVMLMTEGKEEQIYNHSQYTKQSIHRTIQRGTKSLVFYANNPRMIPAGMLPVCHRMHISVPPPPQHDKPQPPPSSRKRGGKPVAAVKAKRGRMKKGSLKNGGITEEEFVELKSAGCAVVTHAVPRPTLLALTRAADQDPSGQLDAEGGTPGELNLAEWLPWQNSLQETHQFGHSRRSRHLIELIEFTDLQQDLPPDEDNYGQEMKHYLVNSDVPRDPKSSGSSKLTPLTDPHPKDPPERPLQSGGTSEKPRKQADGQRKETKMIEDFSEDSRDSDVLPEVHWTVGLAEIVKQNRAQQNDEENLLADTFREKMKKEQRKKEAITAQTGESYEASGIMDVGIGMPDAYLPPPPPDIDICSLLESIKIEDLTSFDMQSVWEDINREQFSEGQTRSSPYAFFRPEARLEEDQQQSRRRSSIAPGKQQKQWDVEVNNGNRPEDSSDMSMLESYFSRNFFDDDFDMGSIFLETFPFYGEEGSSSQKVTAARESKAEVMTEVPEPSDREEEDVALTHDDEDLANFDLGYDFDEDIIPPSPEEPSVSQVAWRSVSCSGQSAPGTADKRKKGGLVSAPPQVNSYTDDDFDDYDDGTLLGVIEEGVEEDSPRFSSSFQPKESKGLVLSSDLAPLPSTVDNVSELDSVWDDFSEERLPELSSRKHKQDPRPCGGESQGRVEGLSPRRFGATRRDDVKSADRGTTSEKSLATNEEPQRIGHLSDASTNKRPEIQHQLSLSAIGTSRPGEDFEDFPADFPMLLDDSDFEVESKPQEVTCSERSPVMQEKTGGAVFCSTPVNDKHKSFGTPGSSLSRRASASKTASPPLALEQEDDDVEESVIVPRRLKRVWALRSPDATGMQDDDDDFEESAILPRKQAKVRFQSPEGSGGKDDSDDQENQRPPMKRSKKNKIKHHGFLDNEAELSGDVGVSSDEDEEDLEMLEGSFIDNDTMMTQASQIDMQAVYLKSVQSPVHQGGHQKGRYRLQFSPDPVNVYSQLPSHLEEESQYQEDSFCVGSAEESSCEGSEDDESWIENVSSVKKKKQQAVKPREGRRRVHQIADSSSDENENFDRLPPSQIDTSYRKSVKALLSSSDDCLDTSAAKAMPSPLSHGDYVQKKALQDSGSGFQMPSVPSAFTSYGHVSIANSRQSDSVSMETSGQNVTDEGDICEQKDAYLSSRSSDLVSTKFTSIMTEKRGRMVIFVDSREISGAQDILSDLRLKHNITVCVRQLAGCDYIVSNRMAVERTSWSNLFNGSNRSKLLQRLKQMMCLYDRSVMIVEKDRVKKGEKDSKFRHYTKYAASLISQLCQISLQLFFTEDQIGTAYLLAQLAVLECRKNMAIHAPVDWTPEQEKEVQFFQTLPGLSITHALNLSFNFKSIRDVLKSCVKDVETKGHMSQSRAIEGINFFRRRFSLALSSTK